MPRPGSPAPTRWWLALCLLAGLWLPVASPGATGIAADACLDILTPDEVPAVRLQVEKATTPAKHQQGLMGRLLPDDASAMLFIFPTAAPRVFWMRDTPGSLDMLFADDRRRIIHIARETRPFTDDPHPSQGPARYVLETRGGFAARHGVVPGMGFRWHDGPCPIP